MSVSEPRVRYEQDGPVGRITFDNPGALNALTMSMWQELGDICRRIADDRSLRVVTMRGAGDRAFVSGTDISSFLDFTSGRDGVAYERKMDEYLGLVEALPTPTVALVNGWAVGGGIALSFACDFRIATTTAKFGSPISRTIGNCLSGKSYARIVNHVGISIAKRVVMLGEIVGAAELQAAGHLVSLVEPEGLDAAAEEICARLAANAPITMAVTKAAIRRQAYAATPDIDDLLERTYGSADFKGAVRAFMAKEKPVWNGD